MLLREKKVLPLAGIELRQGEPGHLPLDGNAIFVPL